MKESYFHNIDMLWPSPFSLLHTFIVNIFIFSLLRLSSSNEWIVWPRYWLLKHINIWQVVSCAVGTWLSDFWCQILGNIFVYPMMIVIISNYQNYLIYSNCLTIFNWKCICILHSAYILVHVFLQQNKKLQNDIDYSNVSRLET